MKFMNINYIQKPTIKSVITFGNQKTIEEYLSINLKETTVDYFSGVPEDVENLKFSHMLQLGLMRITG